VLATPQALAALGAAVHLTPRGGDATFHGPGQLVIYPVLSLRRLGCGARAYVEGLEDVMAAVAASHGVRAAGRLPGAPGVWVDGRRKLGAVGVRVSQGVTTHGAALNVATDLSFFTHIVPCGIHDKARWLGNGSVGRSRSVALRVGNCSPRMLLYRMVTDLALDDKNHTPALISWYEENKPRRSSEWGCGNRSNTLALAASALTWPTCADGDVAGGGDARRAAEPGRGGGAGGAGVRCALRVHRRVVNALRHTLKH
jgi:lipoate-protein ligase B